MGISERRRLVYSAVAIGVVGMVTGLIVGNVLLASPSSLPGQYNERATEIDNENTIAHTHDGNTHSHTTTTSTTITETTPHYTFHQPPPTAITQTTTSDGSSPPSTTKPTVYEVMQVNETFNPHLITIPVGSTVTWTSYDTDSIVHDQHTVYVEGLFDSGSIPYLASFSWTFTEPGVFDVFCHPHESMEMQVIVE
jgi:plastocyanin